LIEKIFQLDLEINNIKESTKLGESEELKSELARTEEQLKGVQEQRNQTEGELLELVGKAEKVEKIEPVKVEEVVVVVQPGKELQDKLSALKKELEEVKKMEQ
jgi:outer membrane protein TolC